jgi:hypothetical protein
MDFLRSRETCLNIVFFYTLVRPTMNHLAFRNLNTSIRSISIMMIIFAVQGCTPDKSNQMAFIEASGYVDTMGGPGVVRWLSTDKVIYGVNSTGKKNSFTGVNEPELESSKQVSIFDTTTQKTSLYRKGQLSEYKKGKILIRLALSDYEHKENRQIAKPKYLYGNFGSETQDEYDQANRKPSRYLPSIDKCPSDKANGESYKAWLLSSENACLRIPDEYGKDRRWIYYQDNGQAQELTTSTGIFIPDFKWVSWLGAYVIENRFPSIETTAQVRVLYTNGNFELLDINQAVQHAKPTKVGVIGAINNKGAIDGLRIFIEGAVHQITQGTVRLTEVSPDGCKVAYVTNRKLRVIDVCSIFYGSRTLIKNHLN